MTVRHKMPMLDIFLPSNTLDPGHCVLSVKVITNMKIHHMGHEGDLLVTCWTCVLQLPGGHVSVSLTHNLTHSGHSCSQRQEGRV